LKYLAIDTSGDLVVLAVNGNKQSLKYLKGCMSQHSLTLMPYVEQCLSESGMALSDVDFFAVVIGPGSFTGIRIGVSTIKALCFATGKKALSLTAFDCLAYDDNAPEKAFCVIDANHDNFYCSAYDNKNVVLPPCFLSKTQVAEKSEGYTVVAVKPVDFAGAVVADISCGLKKAIETLYSNEDGYREPVPLYVKKSQAEEES